MNLHRLPLESYKMSEIKPSGWLLNQLKIQAEGLSGNLDKFWPDIKESMWIGGDKEGWERVPYWLDGFIPLAYLLDDDDMKKRAAHYMDYIIIHQDKEGWICPGKVEDRSHYDVWALFLILKVLVEYYDATNDERVEGVVNKALSCLDRHIDNNTLFAWGQTRWYECFISIIWLYERTNEKWLIDLASKIRCQGFEWKDFFKLWPYTLPDEKGRWSQMSHVVNNAMMLKEGILSYVFTGNEDDRNSIFNKIDMLDRYHGRVNGIFSGDECLAGLSPVHGTELCAVAEYMYSLEWGIKGTVSVKLADRLEKIAYNALPATFSPDMWSHQYDQQINQVQCTVEKEHIFNTNGGSSNIFGLEPNYGCCTANLSQPWPKFALSTFMRCKEGVVIPVYAPSRLSTEINGQSVEIEIITDYPFKNNIKVKVKTKKPVEFSLYLRVPEWVEKAVINTEDKNIMPESGQFYELRKCWKNESVISITLPIKAKLSKRPNNTFAIERGPLVYSLLIGEKWTRINEEETGKEFPHCDWEIRPTTPWNYGVCLNDESIKNVEFIEKEVGKVPFSPEGAPIIAYINGKKIDWGMEYGCALERPGMSWIDDKIERLTIIPYGCTNIRMTEMPLLD